MWAVSGKCRKRITLVSATNAAVDSRGVARSARDELQPTKELTAARPEYFATLSAQEVSKTTSARVAPERPRRPEGLVPKR